MNESTLLRFTEKILVGTCWQWTGSRSRGYGYLWDQGRLQPAHRLSYEHFVGTIPDGLQIDHLCRNRACVNPEHLEPVTACENSRRGAKQALKTHCVNGHPYIEENTGRGVTGRRYCRVCKRAYMRRRYLRIRQVG